MGLTHTVGTDILRHGAEFLRERLPPQERFEQLAHGVRTEEAMERLKAAVAASPNVIEEPAPVIEAVDFNECGAVLAAQRFTRTDRHWQVCFGTNPALSEAFGSARDPVSEARACIARPGG